MNAGKKVMNKINASFVIVILLLVAGCSRFTADNKAKPTPTPTNYSTPIAENSVEPTNQSNKANDNSQITKSGDKDIAELEEKVRKDPKDNQAYFQLGKKYQSLKNEGKAIDSYKKAIEIKPDFVEANYELGRLYFNKKDFETSLPYLQKAAKLKDTSPEYLIALGDNYRELKRCNFAIPPYGNSVNYNDKIPAAYYGMGLCYLELDNRQSAETQLRSLEKLDKNLANQLKNKIAQYK
jgi:tetratricopeptide (TPR) repeat protein